MKHQPEESSALSPIDVVNRFYDAENAYMNVGGGRGGADFGAVAATLDPDVVLHQAPDLPWGGEFHGHAGYEDWARKMSDAFDRLEVKDARFLTEGGTVVILCRRRQGRVPSREAQPRSARSNHTPRTGSRAPHRPPPMMLGSQ